MLENTDEKVYNTIYSYLKPVVYQENSFIIRKGEPLDLMLFITQGVVWSFGSSSSPMERLERGDYYGIELLEWQLRSTSYSDFPIATCNVKSHTKVEAFTLSAIDLGRVLISCWSKIPAHTEDEKKALKPLAIFSLREFLRLNNVTKREKDHDQPQLNGHSSQISNLYGCFNLDVLVFRISILL